MDDYTRKMIRVAVAQTCLNVGWSMIHSSPLEILTDLLSDYILGLCKRTNNYAFLFGQTEPNLDHLGLAFMDLGISLPELEEYVNYFDNNNCPEVAQYPVPKESSLNFLKPGSREVVTRPVHIHEHLPPMYPHLEEQDTAGASKLPGASSPPQVEVANAASGETPASLSPGSGLKRRGETPTVESFAIRRARALAEEETRQLREISSVMMTTSGFLSHAREGKLPEVRTVIPEPEPEEQPPPPQPPTQIIEPKVEPLPPPPPEKKKKKKSSDPLKKVEKDKVKEKDDHLPINLGILCPSLLGVKSSTPNLIPDDSQIKKLTTVKETNKLKALKPGATKAIAITPNSFIPTAKTEKKHKPKRPNSPAAAIAGQSPLGVPKAKIPKLLQIKERIVVDDIASDAFPDIKLTAEPDKQKLNIFKKISKVKDDHDETERPDIRKIMMEVDSHVGVKLGKDVTVELVPVETPKKPLIPPSEIKEEKDDVAVDVENFHSPTTVGSVSFGDDIMPATPTTPKTPDIPKILTDHKKKKREKHKEKRERDKYVSSPVSSRTSDDNIVSKPKTPEVIVDAPDDHYPPFSFLSYPTGPTIIPPNLASNPLIPQIRVSDAFGPRILHPPVVSLPHPPPQKEVITPTTSASVSTTSSAPATPLTTTPTESPVTPVKKKEKKEKKKEKVKKKKEKKEEKSKKKEKSEKKKLKLMKKQKLEEKIKLKKDKKDKKKETQSQEEKRGDSPSVPKITFKLGPDPQRELSPNPKITFKPLVKKEEEGGEVPKKHASDLAQTSTPITKHHKGSSSKLSKSGGATDLSGHQKLHDSPLPTKTVAPLTVPAPSVQKVEPETNESNQLWICPACGRPDDGSPMIACDACDMWYHYVCVGIQEAPESDWFCQGCISKRPDLVDKKKKHKKKK